MAEASGEEDNRGAQGDERKEILALTKKHMGK
jgi:hypothetical protein